MRIRVLHEAENLKQLCAITVRKSAGDSAILVLRNSTDFMARAVTGILHQTRIYALRLRQLDISCGVPGQDPASDNAILVDIPVLFVGALTVRMTAACRV
jgi:hypothetical protein